jgi:hypothetical protein
MAFTRRNTTSFSDQRSSQPSKEPEKLKPVKPLKLCIKRIYCSSCKALVNSREQKTDGGTQIICNKCGLTIRFKEGDVWKKAPAASK